MWPRPQNSVISPATAGEPCLHIFRNFAFRNRHYAVSLCLSGCALAHSTLRVLWSTRAAPCSLGAGGGHTRCVRCGGLGVLGVFLAFRCVPALRNAAAPLLWVPQMTFRSPGATPPHTLPPRERKHQIHILPCASSIAAVGAVAAIPLLAFPSPLPPLFLPQVAATLAAQSSHLHLRLPCTPLAPPPSIPTLRP